MSERALTVEPRWLSQPTVLAMHAQLIERYGGLHGVRDLGIVLSALARPVNRWSYEPAADLANLAAAYLVSLAQSQGFNDGNKRTGLACALVFLELNGSPLHTDPAALFALTMAAANNQADGAMVATFLRERLAGHAGGSGAGAK